MITFERSFNYELIRCLLTHSAVWNKISDDSSPAPTDYQPIESDAFWYVIVRDVDVGRDFVEILGLFLFVPQNGVCWEVHTALLPKAWGDRAMQAALELPDWIWENTPCRRIVTNVPESNRVALHFALDAGMRPYGRNEKSWLKGGELWDQICLGISAPEEMSGEIYPQREDHTGRTGAESIEPLIDVRLIEKLDLDHGYLEILELRDVFIHQFWSELIKLFIVCSKWLFPLQRAAQIAANHKPHQAFTIS